MLALNDAFRITAIPEHPSSIQCHCAGNQCYANAYPSKSLPTLSHSMPKRIVSVPYRSYLCRSYTCPCQCSVTPLVYYSMPKPSAPLLCPSVAYLRFALAPFFFALPLLRYARLDLSVQCLGDSSPCLCSTYLRSASLF